MTPCCPTGLWWWWNLLLLSPNIRTELNKGSATLTMTMEAADVLLSDVHWLAGWADLEWREGVLSVTFRDTTFTVATVNKRWVRGDYSSGEGQKTVFVGVWSLKMGRKDEHLCQLTSLCGGEGLDGCLHPCLQKSQLIELYFTSHWRELKGCEITWCRWLISASEQLVFWMIHSCDRSVKDARLSGRVISSESESDNRLVSQTNISLFTAETESQQNSWESRSG